MIQQLCDAVPSCLVNTATTTIAPLDNASTTFKTLTYSPVSHLVFINIVVLV